MEAPIKQLKQGTVTFFPQTSAEAILIHEDKNVITLDKFVNKTTTIVVNSRVCNTIKGSQDQTIQLGDDFTFDENNKIKLTWNGNT